MKREGPEPESGRFRRWLERTVERIRGSKVEHDLRAYAVRLKAIAGREEELGSASEERLRSAARDLSCRGAAGTHLDDLVIEAFSLVREAARRSLGLRAHDVQLIAGMALHEGLVAEMQTGEGKTLAAVFAAALHGMTHRGVHVLTVNDYLARRDAEWMRPVYDRLGITVGFVQEGMPREARREAYRRDVTYVTAREAGFDFLRDQLCRRLADIVHRDQLAYAIVDEADSILVDEARIPLVIAGDTGTGPPDLLFLAALARELRPGIDYATDIRGRNVFLSEERIDRAEAAIGRGPLHDPENVSLVIALQQALHARALLRRDIDYIVRGNEIELVDEFTGRVAEKRQWPDGLQAAVAAKEGVGPPVAGTILGSITLQHFLRLYSRLAGMTATARAAHDEFAAFYGLGILVIPPNRPCRRIDEPDAVFATKEAKERSLVVEIVRSHALGRPILVGTANVKESEALAARLLEEGVGCNVLNARNDEEEASIVAAAGRLGAVTISTNMAGRGTDIRLGGAEENEREAVVALGGLLVLGTNRHESRRIDDQLRGRAGRQGDPGSSRFFVSLEDDLIVRFGIARLIGFASEGLDGGQAESPRPGREIERTQRIVEGENLQIRRTLERYSAIVESQRRIVQQRRRELLAGGPVPGILARDAPERHRELALRFGHAVIDDVERTLLIHHLDWAWAEHLATVSDIRDGIHLQSFSIFEPLPEFERDVAASFRTMEEAVNEGVRGAFERVEVGPDGVDMEREGLKAPSATWTYMISDMPFGSPFERLMTQIGDILKRALRQPVRLR